MPNLAPRVARPHCISASALTTAIVAVALFSLASSPQIAQAQQPAPPKDGAKDKEGEAPAAKPKEEAKPASGEERRKKLARLGTGKVRLPPPRGKVYPLNSIIERTMEVNPQLLARKHAELFAKSRQGEASWAAFPDTNFLTTFTVVPFTVTFPELLT